MVCMCTPSLVCRKTKTTKHQRSESITLSTELASVWPRYLRRVAPKAWVVVVLVLRDADDGELQYMSQARLLRRRPSQTCKVLPRASRSSPAKYTHATHPAPANPALQSTHIIARCMEALRTRRSDMRPSARRSGTRVSLLVLAIINAAKHAMLPP
jgi:hypothetical protein